MGTTFSSIHVYGKDVVEDSSLKFRSFSDGWQTCITDLSEIDFNTVLKNVKRISKAIDTPVLWFFVNDSDYIDFVFYVKGKIAAKYSIESKNLYGIPDLIGLGEGNKKRLSNILQVADIGVVNDLQVAAGIFDTGGPDADALDSAAEIIQYDDIAHMVLAFKDDKDTGDGVFDQALSAEADDQRGNSQGGKDTCQIDTQDTQGPYCADNDADEVGQAGEQTGHGAGVLAAVGEQLQKPADHNIDQPNENCCCGGADELTGCQHTGIHKQIAEIFLQLGGNITLDDGTQEGEPLGVDQQQQNNGQNDEQNDLIRTFHVVSSLSCIPAPAGAGIYQYLAMLLVMAVNSVPAM